MKRGILLACLLIIPVAARAQDRIAGLLSLPEVFGSGACDRFVPEEIPIHAAADSDSVIGTIRVDKYWTFDSTGGCEGLGVRVHSTTGQNLGELPTREAGYEAPAAIVLERRDRWFKVRLPTGAGWIRASERDEYLSLERALTNGLTYLTSATDGRLATAPGVKAPETENATLAAGQSVRVTESREVDGQLWLHLEVLSHSPCESTESPTVASRGWMRAHASSGEPTVWFYSRGC